MLVSSHSLLDDPGGWQLILKVMSIIMLMLSLLAFMVVNSS